MDKKKVLIALIVLGLLLSTFTLIAGAHYVGSKNSDVYHDPSCHYVDRIKSENLIYFDTPEDAVAAGYRPCKVCKPPTKSSTTWRVVDTVEMVVEIEVPTPSLSAPLPVHNMNTGENFSKIQAAIDDNDTKYGHTITVDPGTYTENVKVTKSLTIKSTSGNPEDTIVQAANSSDYAFEVTADYVNIRGFTVKGATGHYLRESQEYGYCGLYLYNAKYCNIFDIIACENYFGICLSYGSNKNTLTGNEVFNNTICGIAVLSSSNNTLTNNNALSNKYGIAIYIPPSSNNTLINNNASYNYYGIYLWDSSNNKIHFNNFINNTDNVYSSYSTNLWNSTEEITYAYDGTTYESYLGNYWDDYEGTDADGDGIGDTHYSIYSENDESADYPLMKPFENYILTTSHK